ncbi:MAG: hypothetical protein CMN28_00220 [Salinisphaeraceae bacterium]|jgi:hypothetical protein|nr:hypothetical protein [Salinisphaeraceae bacterium]
MTSRPATASLSIPALAAALAAPSASGATLDAGLTSTFQTTDDSDTHSEQLISADLVVTQTLGPGELLLYLEGSSSPQRAGVSSGYPEANADAGTALDRDGDGRFQVSELRYALPLTESGSLHAGLLDATVFLDASGPLKTTYPVYDYRGIANDETTQFLGAEFVNNPLIEFPDYAPGVVYGWQDSASQSAFRLVLTGSNGLADNPDASYSSLLELDESGRGVFLASEVGRRSFGSGAVRLGLWLNSRDHQTLDGEHDDARNYGAYAVADGGLGRGGWNLRAGWANPDVSAGEYFLAAALEQPVGLGDVGLAGGVTLASDRLDAASEDRLHTEIYWRVPVTPAIHISPDLQYIQHSDFRPGEDAFILGLRLTATLSSS